MRTVGYHFGPVVGVHLQNLRGVEDTGVTEHLAYRVQDKGGRDRILEGNLDNLLFERRDGVRQMNVQRVVAIQQTVWYDFCLNLLDHWWQSAQSLNQTGIAVNLVIQAADDVVIGPTVHAEVLIVGCHLLQGVGQIKRHLLLLCIEQDGELVRLGDNVNHPLMLTLIIVVEALLRI